MKQETAEKRKGVTRSERLRRREAILEVLAKAADDSEFLAELADNPGEALKAYYTLTADRDGCTG